MEYKGVRRILIINWVKMKFGETILNYIKISEIDHFYLILNNGIS